MDLNKINKLSDHFDDIAQKKPKATSGTKSPLVNLFKEAQEQIVQATLDCTNLKQTKKSLKNFIRSTESLKHAYTHQSKNLLVKIGLIKPRGMKEALSHADALITKAQAALDVLSELKITSSNRSFANAFDLKEHLKALEGDDPQILIRLLKQSGEGEPFESCRAELEDLATEQFLQLVSKVKVPSEGGRSECVYKRGKWRLKWSKKSANEIIKLKADQLLAYLPYVSFEDMKKTNFFHNTYVGPVIYNKLDPRDPRLAILVNILINGIDAARASLSLDNVSGDFASVLLKIAKDANHQGLRLDAMLLDHLKDRNPRDWSKFSKFFKRARDLHDRLDKGAFQLQDLPILWDLVNSGILENKPLVKAAQLNLPLYASLTNLEETHGGQNFETRAVLFTLRALKAHSLENIEDATRFLEDILGLKDFNDLEEKCFRTFNKLQELKALESPFEGELRKLLPQLSQMDEMVSLPAEEEEPFAVSAMRYTLESHSKNLSQLFESLLSAENLDNKYPLMDSLPTRLIRIASILGPPEIAFLENKVPYIAYVIKILKMRTHQGLTPEALLPLDLQLELHQTLRMQPVATFEEEYLVKPKLVDPMILDEISELGRFFGKIPFTARADIDDSWVEKHEDSLFKTGLEKVDLRGTAVTPAYALRLQTKYGNVEYDDSLFMRKPLLDRDKGDYTIKVGNLERKVYKDLIFQACPGEKITTYDQWLSLPIELSQDELNAFLEFCYTGAMSNASGALLISLAAKADQLGSELLKDYCYRLLIATTTKANVLERFKAAEQNAPSLIYQYLVRFIKANCRTDQEGFTAADKEAIYRIAKIVIEFPPLTPPKHINYAPQLTQENNFTVKSKSGDIFEGNLTLLGLRSGYFRALENYPEDKRFKNEGMFDFDDQLLSNVMWFLKHGEWPGELAEENLQEIWGVADFFDIPLLKFKIAQVEGVEFETVSSIKKRALPADAITPSDWTAWGMEGVDEELALEMLPENINEILSQPSPLHPRYTVGQKHLLVWVPEGFTIEKLRDIVKRHATPKTPGHLRTVPMSEHLEPAFLRKAAKGHWALVATDVIPESYNRTLEAQEALLQQKSSEKVRYEIPEVLDLATAVFAKFLKTSAQILEMTPDRSKFATCKERSEGGNVVIGSNRNRFGIFSRSDHEPHPSVGVMPAVVLL